MNAVFDNVVVKGSLLLSLKAIVTLSTALEKVARPFRK